MKDILQDVVSHTHSLGLGILKITTDTETTNIDGLAEDRSIILYATTNDRVDEFEGVFGMTNLEKLILHLKNPEYQTNAKIDVVQETRNDETIPSYIHFENEAGDFKNDYRFMNQQIIETKLKTVKFKGANWDVQFEPTAAAVARLKLMAAAHTEEPHVTMSTTKEGLLFSFGDAASHAGEFIFHNDIGKQSLKQSWAYPVTQLQAILNLDGKITMAVSDNGAMKVAVDSGLISYEYILPAQAK
jgi:hypothetical protein